MKLDEFLEDYVLEVEEIFRRYYYSAKPLLEKSESRRYELKKGSDIYTGCGFLEVNDYLGSEDDIRGIIIYYLDYKYDTKSAEVTPGKKVTIRLSNGRYEVYCLSDCTFSIVRRNENKIE